MYSYLTLLHVLTPIISTRLSSVHCYGVLVGLAAGSFFAPLIATVSSWFVENRGLAVALVSAGMGVAPLTISPFTAWLITHMDWRQAQLVVAALATLVILPAALLIRMPPTLAASGTGATEGEGAAAVGSPGAPSVMGPQTGRASRRERGGEDRLN